MTEPARERNAEECEQFAEQTGNTCAVGGHFPHVPFGPAPTFLPEPSFPRYDRVHRLGVRTVQRRGGQRP